jgi:hypothetical protein
MKCILQELGDLDIMQSLNQTRDQSSLPNEAHLSEIPDWSQTTCSAHACHFRVRLMAVSPAYMHVEKCKGIACARSSDI